MYKLLVSDCDGTLLNSKSELPEEVKNSISDLLSRGGKFALCSGRTVSSIMYYAKKLGLHGYVIAYQGATIADIDTGEIVFDDGFTQDEAIEVLEKVEKYNKHTHLYCGNEFYVNGERRFLDFYENVCKVKGILTDERLADIARRKKGPFQKILLMMEIEERNEIFEKIKAELEGEKYSVICSSPIMVEIVKNGISKGNAVKKLASILCTDISQVIAVGDELNDYSMISVAGLGLAVRNASDFLKRKGVEVYSKSNDENAIKYIIEEYMTFTEK